MDGPWRALSHSASGMPHAPRPAQAHDFRAAAPQERTHVPDAPLADANGEGHSPPPFIVHTVLKSDTLQGLAFKFACTVTEIRLANDLPTDNLATCATLRIPAGARAPLPARREEPDTRAAVLRRFRVANRVSESEARYYLEDAEWDEVKAALAIKQDLEFERQNAPAMNAALAAADVGAHHQPQRPASVTSTGTGKSFSLPSLLGFGRRAPPADAAASQSSSLADARVGSDGDGGGESASIPLIDRPRSQQGGGQPGTVLRHRRKDD